MRVPRGLRTRLVVGFVLVTALGALTTAALTFGQARSAILERVQSSAVHDLRTQIDSLALDLPSDPDQADLRALTLQLDRAGGSRGWRTAASLHDGPLVVAASAAPALPAQLRSATATATTALVQRFQRDGRPWLAIAVPVRDAARPAARPPLVVFASFSLAAQQRDVDSLVTAARAGALPVALAATLQRDTAVLRDMEARARRFAADVSHELRTPLAAMTAVTGLLDEDVAAGRMPPETAEAVGLVADETRRLARLVDDLMEVSWFDTGAAVLTLDEVELVQLVRKTLALRHWQDRVPVDIPDGLRIRLDPRRVDVILANLVGNALRHGGPAATALEGATSGAPAVHVYFSSALGLERVSRLHRGADALHVTLQALVQGPDAVERARGLVSFVPPGAPLPLVHIGLRGPVDVRLSFGWGIDRTAERQLVCTVADTVSTTTRAALGFVRVKIHRVDGSTGTRTRTRTP
ncbi:sensor histidine kinase [Streptosporangium sandarakinum]|uniref:sensor histidine kinase n=1 Tax=Streptosporangium sandarakinum TaxID=1260955 RepID=UPI003D935F4A